MREHGGEGGGLREIVIEKERGSTHPCVRAQDSETEQEGVRKKMERERPDSSPVLQCFAVCCSICCSVLHCAAVRCSRERDLVALRQSLNSASNTRVPELDVAVIRATYPQVLTFARRCYTVHER